MLDCRSYFGLLQGCGIRYFAGVPDSLLKDFYSCVSDNTDAENNVIAANEGAAVALVAGHYLATAELGMVYMQNSGIGNAVNPLTSLVDPEVYSIPLLLLVGWRGEPGRKDEPQHIKQGRITLSMLEALGIPHEVHPDTLKESGIAIRRAVDIMKRKESPYAFVVRAGTFQPYKKRTVTPDRYEMLREDAVREVAANLSDDDLIVSTTGKASRELFEYRVATGGHHQGDFLTVGSMGHASQIALSIAVAKPRRRVVCLDGDGAVLMHMGALAIIGARKPANLTHIVINNGAHDSVGGQPTVGHEVDIPAIARACGYTESLRIERKEEIAEAIKIHRDSKGPILLEILVNKGARADLGRPTIPPIENKGGFMRNLAR